MGSDTTLQLAIGEYAGKGNVSFSLLTKVIVRYLNITWHEVH